MALEELSEWLAPTVSERRATGSGHSFHVQTCLLYKTDLKRKKKVVDGVQEWDKAQCGKRKAAKEEDKKNKWNKYRK